MKKIRNRIRPVCLVLAALLLGGVCACAAGTESIAFTDAESAAMSNFMQRGRYLFEDGVMFGAGFDKNASYPSLIRAEVTTGAAEPSLGEFTVLDRHVNANFLTSLDGMLYYVRIDRESGLCCLARIGKDGSGFEKLTEETEAMDWLLWHKDRFYFTDEEHFLVSVDPNGGSRETVLEKRVYYPYFLTDDLLLYQDDEDGETLHLYSLSDASDTRLTELPSYHPVVSGSTLYFAAVPEGESAAHLARLDLSASGAEAELAPGTMGKEFGIYYGEIAGTNGASCSLESWESYSDTGSRGITKKDLYRSSDFIVRADLYADWGTVDYLTLIDASSGKACMFRHVY